MHRWSRKASLFICGCRGTAKAAEKLLSPKGSVSVDKRTNRLLVRDNAAALEALQQWALQMDIPVEQVELAAHIVTINEKASVSWA